MQSSLFEALCSKGREEGTSGGIEKKKNKTEKKTERGKGRVEWGGFRSVQPTNRLEPTICSHARRTRVKNEMLHLVWPTLWQRSSACLSLYGLKSMSCKMTTLADVKLIPRPPEKGTRQNLGHSFVLRAACVRKMTLSRRTRLCQTVPFWTSKGNLHSFTGIGYS